MIMHPACVQLTFCFTSLLALTQSYLLFQPWVRERLGIYPLPKRKPAAAATPLLQVYQPPTQTPPATEVKSGIKHMARRKYSEISGATSDLKKSVEDMVLPAKPNVTKSPPTSSVITKAQQLQQKRLNEAQVLYAAKQRKHDTAADRKKSGGESH